MSEKEDLAEYIRNNYGSCTNPKGCACIKAGKWYGTACPFWKPLAAKDWAGYMTGAKTAHALRKKMEEGK